MKRTSRMQDYRRRRHRLAAGRRGSVKITHGRHPRENGGSHDGWYRLRADGGTEFQFILRRLVEKVAAYPGVSAILYRHLGAETEVQIVAQRPMTGPMRLLASAWAHELAAQHPSQFWSVVANPALPAAPETYQCLYWRKH